MAFPETVNVFLPLIDGHTPIDAGDLNALNDALTNIEDALGYGVSPTYGGSAIGPKGLNDDVRARLDAFLDDEGGLLEVWGESGSINTNLFRQGVILPFRRSLVQSTATTTHAIVSVLDDDSSSGEKANAPAWFWISRKSPSGFWFQGKRASGLDISQDENRSIRWAILVFGDKAVGP